MKALILILVFLLGACQDLPKEYRGEEGKKKLEKYRKQFVEGVVEVKEELKTKIPKEDFFLIIAVRRVNDSGPVAVLRVKNPEFPYKFRITGKHKIRQDRMIEGDLIITARISRSPMAEAQKGDLVGSSQAKAGEKGVKIIIEGEIP